MNPLTRTPRLARSLSIFVLTALVMIPTGCIAPNVKLGDRLGQAGKWDEAVSAYRQAVKKDPYNQDLADRLINAKTHAAEQQIKQLVRAGLNRFGIRVTAVIWRVTGKALGEGYSVNRQ